MNNIINNKLRSNDNQKISDLNYEEKIDEMIQKKFEYFNQFLELNINQQNTVQTLIEELINNTIDIKKSILELKKNEEEYDDNFQQIENGFEEIEKVEQSIFNLENEVKGIKANFPNINNNNNNINSNQNRKSGDSQNMYDLNVEEIE